ncbi:hypothetical protein ACFDBW_14265, partial [Enterococcus lactis]|uniref:hypothetical protein n=1 Tax=Enterococcus lactis TaxID=357441 RepID=UPI0039A489BA
VFRQCRRKRSLQTAFPDFWQSRASLYPHLPRQVFSALRHKSSTWKETTTRFLFPLISQKQQ